METMIFSVVFGASFNNVGMCSLVAKMAVKCAWLMLSSSVSVYGRGCWIYEYLHVFCKENETSDVFYRHQQWNIKYSPTESFPSVSYRLTVIFWYPCSARSMICHSTFHTFSMYLQLNQTRKHSPGLFWDQMPTVSSSPPPSSPFANNACRPLPMCFLRSAI